jgi:hypothetical protein
MYLNGETDGSVINTLSNHHRMGHVTEITTFIASTQNKKTPHYITFAVFEISSCSLMSFSRKLVMSSSNPGKQYVIAENASAE